jgi:hypothetical protein
MYFFISKFGTNLRLVTAFWHPALWYICKYIAVEVIITPKKIIGQRIHKESGALFVARPIGGEKLL